MALGSIRTFNGDGVGGGGTKIWLKSKPYKTIVRDFLSNVQHWILTAFSRKNESLNFRESWSFRSASFNTSRRKRKKESISENLHLLQFWSAAQEMVKFSKTTNENCKKRKERLFEHLVETFNIERNHHSRRESLLNIEVDEFFKLAHLGFQTCKVM